MSLKRLLLALAIGAATAGVQDGPGESQSAMVMPSSTQHDFPGCSVRLQLPSGWAAFETDYSVMHYRDVFLCVNNIGSRDLRVEGASRNDRLPRSLGAYGPDVVAEQLAAGTVYLDFGFWGRPGNVQSFSGQRQDNFEQSVKRISPKHSEIMWKTPQLTAYSVGFIKWGRGWSVLVYFREPVSPVDKQAAFAIIKNIAFIDLPVTSDVRAGAAAFASLPQAVRDSVMEATGQCECCESGVSSRCAPHGSDFQVTLELGERRWTLLVSRDGAVRSIARSED